MYGICGWLGEFGCGKSPASVLDEMSCGLTQVVAKRYWKSTPHAGLHVTAGHFHVDNEIWASLAGEPFWSSPVIVDKADPDNPAKTLALAYRRYDKELLQYLHGPFALA